MVRRALPPLAMLLLLASSPAWGQAAPPAEHEDTAFDVMNVLARHGLHDLDDESWNLYGQFTYISHWKLPFEAAYSNPGTSLSTAGERSFTGSFTLFFGARLWRGAELYFVPEVISEQPLSGLHGIGGAIQNFELQKTGSTTPQLYRSRTMLRQIIPLGGAPVIEDSDPMQLGTTLTGRRLVITAGNFTILDVFDRNSVTGDPRRTFLNMAFMTYASWDFPSDARGYSWGGTVEAYWDDWTFRYGRITPPQHPNQLEIDFRIWRYYGDQVELEHRHRLAGAPGAVRLLGYRNRVETGRFDDAVAAVAADPNHNAAACQAANLFNYGSTNTMAPDLCWVRRPNTKLGVGVDVEQSLGAGFGAFFRGMYSDGRTEVLAYNPADRSIATGVLGKGTAWRRPFDLVGAGFGMSWISAAHARYLGMGGVDGFIGDGRIRQAAEGIVEVFYSFNLARAIWLSADFQHLWHPAFNADRGPVEIVGTRIHAEF
jgi:hypothetical protein